MYRLSYQWGEYLFIMEKSEKAQLLVKSKSMIEEKRLDYYVNRSILGSADFI